ncbi:MAG: hypothetical protein Q8L53_16825 [Aestuariivirga sp.]|nr:hypothetical protein [Aestuariivirga sp.]
MRGFSKVYSNLWQSGKFNALTDNQSKLAYLYLLTSPHSNSSGCFDIKTGYATADLNCSEHDYRMAIDSLSKVGLIEVENGLNTILITNWVEFNEPTNAKHSLGVMNHLNAASSNILKTKRVQEFIKIIDAKKHERDPSCGAVLERLCHDYRMAIEPLSSPRPKTETQTLDQEGDLNKDQTLNLDARESSRSPLRAVAVKGDGLAALEEEEFPRLPDHLNRLLNTNLMRRTG